MSSRVPRYQRSALPLATVGTQERTEDWRFLQSSFKMTSQTFDGLSLP